MDHESAADEEDVLSVRLDVVFGRQPVQGRLRTPTGAEEPFVGWVGFVDALPRLHERENRDRKGRDDRQPHEKLILITGGIGKTGRRIAQRLTDRGVPFRIGTPSSDPPFD
jgi:hypothetical protein